MSQDEALPRSEIALEALKEIRALLDEWDDSDRLGEQPTQQIDHILELTYAKLRMADMVRNRRDATWLAKVDSLTWPRRLERSGETEAAICFNVSITDGAKAARGKKVEVRMSLDEALFLGENLVGWTTHTDGTTTTPASLGELLPGGSKKKDKV